MLTSLDHIILGVSDLDAAFRTYATLLGRRPSWRGEHPGRGTANVLFRLDNTTLEVLTPSGPGPVGAALEKWLEARGEGPVGLAFGTADANACHTRFSEAGLEPEGVVKGFGRDTDSGAFRRWRRVPLPPSKTRGVVLFGIEHEAESLISSAGLAVEETAAVVALDHAVVRTSDAEAAKALYGDGLGLRLALDKRFEQWGARLLFFRVGGITVEIAAKLDDGGDADEGDRLWGLSYRVPDADAARQRLVDAEFDVSEVRTGRRPGTRVFTVRGPTHGVATLMLEVTDPPCSEAP